MSQEQYTVKSEETSGDSPEYLQSMLEKAGNAEVSDLNQQDDSLILGKFKDVEALAEAYKNLESKLGQPAAESPETTPEESATTDAEEASVELKRPTEDVSADDAESAKVFEEFGRKYAEKGEFTEEDYAALEAKGFPKDVVQIYEQGLKSLQQSRTTAAANAVGGTEALKQIQSWAGQNLSDAELAAFNKQLSSAQTAEDVGVIYATLKTKYQAASGEANLVSGAASTPRGAAFSNRSEMVKAMSDPRYGSDPRYTKEVEQKVSNSDFL